MMNYEFDRHSIIKKLIAVGITEAQAEELANAIAEGRKHDLNNLATKMDVLETKAELKQEIAAAEIRLSEKVAEIDKSLSEKVVEIDKKLSEKITEVDKRLFERIEQAKNTMILWYISIAIAMTGIIISALKLIK